MPTILDTILATKRREIADAQQAISENKLRAALKDAPKVRNFHAPLSQSDSVNLIAEIKKASPSAGIIRPDFDPGEIATIYAEHGATCLSVLTDVPYFQGHLSYLNIVRSAVDLPLLRKDFILDTYQLLEARVAGADAVLLIAECLDDHRLRELYHESLELGMTPLVEFYEPENLQRVLNIGATFIGINNRNLRTFETVLDHTIHLRKQIPDHCLVVSESGIRTREDVARLRVAGVDAMLVGETLMKNRNIGEAVDALLGQ
jgi:indole-3-glycerol phosphate synthase